MYVNNSLIGTQDIALQDFIIEDIGNSLWSKLDVRMYNDVLTTDEVTYNYSFGSRSTNPGTSNVVAHYKMDDISDSVSYDSSGNNNHGSKESITPVIFHYEGVDVPYSWQNTVGFSQYKQIHLEEVMRLG